MVATPTNAQRREAGPNASTQKQIWHPDPTPSNGNGVFVDPNLNLNINMVTPAIGMRNNSNNVHNINTSDQVPVRRGSFSSEHSQESIATTATAMVQRLQVVDVVQHQHSRAGAGVPSGSSLTGGGASSANVRHGHSAPRSVSTRGLGNSRSRRVPLSLAERIQAMIELDQRRRSRSHRVTSHASSSSGGGGGSGADGSGLIVGNSLSSNWTARTGGTANTASTPGGPLAVSINPHAISFTVFCAAIGSDPYLLSLFDDSIDLGLSPATGSQAGSLSAGPSYSSTHTDLGLGGDGVGGGGGGRARKERDRDSLRALVTSAAELFPWENGHGDRTVSRERKSTGGSYFVIPPPTDHDNDEEEEDGLLQDPLDMTDEQRRQLKQRQQASSSSNSTSSANANANANANGQTTPRKQTPVDPDPERDLLNNSSILDSPADPSLDRDAMQFKGTVRGRDASHPHHPRSRNSNPGGGRSGAVYGSKDPLLAAPTVTNSPLPTGYSPPSSSSSLRSDTGTTGRNGNGNGRGYSYGTGGGGSGTGTGTGATGDRSRRVPKQGRGSGPRQSGEGEVCCCAVQ